MEAKSPLQVVEGFYDISLFSKERSQVFEGKEIAGVYSNSLKKSFLGSPKIALSIIDQAHGYIGIGVIGVQPDAPQKQLLGPLCIPKLYVDNAQIVKEIGVFWIASQQLL